MAKITASSLHKDQIIWYRYSMFESLMGPFRVKRVYSNQDGDNALLSECSEEAEERVLNLADDDVFGQLLIYDAKP